MELEALVMLENQKQEFLNCMKKKLNLLILQIKNRKLLDLSSQASDFVCELSTTELKIPKVKIY